MEIVMDMHWNIWSLLGLIFFVNGPVLRKLSVGRNKETQTWMILDGEFLGS